MDCDQIFFVLTAAPFPTGASSDAMVERHLLACSGCRRFANALRPTTTIDHESLPAAERECLPRYREELRPVPVGLPTPRQTVATSQLTRSPRPAAMSMARRPSQELGMAPNAQLAAFVLSSRTPRHGLRDLAALVTLASGLFAGAWGLGWLAM